MRGLMSKQSKYDMGNINLVCGRKVLKLLVISTTMIDQPTNPWDTALNTQLPFGTLE